MKAGLEWSPPTTSSAARLHLLVDRRQRVLVQAVDLVLRASCRPRRQRLHRGGAMSGQIAAFVRDKLGHEPKDLAPFRACSHPFERRSAPITSGSSSSATACSAWSSPRRLYERYPNEPEGNLSKRLQRAGRPRDLRRNGREIGVPALRPPRQAGARGWREPERQRRRRRRRGADRRPLPRRRAGGCRAVHPRDLGARPLEPAAGPAASQIRASGTRRRQGRQGARSTRSSPAPALTTRRSSRSESRSRSSAKPRPKGRASRKRKPRQRKLCCRGCNE